MKLTAMIALLLCSMQLFSEDRVVRADRMCTARKTAPAHYTGAIVNLKILLVQFADVRCRMDADGTSPRYSCVDFENLLGSEGEYVSPGMYSPDGDELFGSMNDFYINMSGGRIRINAFVINRRDSLHGKPVWITLGQTKEYYQQSTMEIFLDALNSAVAAGLDPSVANNAPLVIIYAGNTYFSRGGLNPREEDFIYVMSEVQGRPYGEERPNARFSRIGIHCHEFGHSIGIGHSTGGRADLMCGGFWNGSVEGNAPAPFNAKVRSQMGWTVPIPAGNVISQAVDLPYSLTDPTIYLMRNSAGDEFYLENRRFDQTMTIGTTVVPDYNNVRFFPPAGPHNAITQGIFVWRVNTIGDPLDPGYSSEGLVYASGRYGRTFPENDISDTDDGVPFPGVRNNRLLTPWSDPRSPYIREADYFNPASFHYTLYVPNTKGGANCGMEVLSEDRAGGTFRVRLYTSNPPNPALAAVQTPDSLSSGERGRTVVRQDPGTLHQVFELGGEIFYRRSADDGASWNLPSLISSGNGGSSSPCMTLSGPALLMAWQMVAYDAADTGRVVYMSRSTDAGISWCPFYSVGWSYHCGEPGAYPSLSGAKDGSAVIVYRADRSLLVSSTSHDQGVSWSDPLPVSDVTGVSVTGSDPSAPRSIALDQNYPNPFNPSTTIRFSLPGMSRMTLNVYNALGQQVATLMNGEVQAGTHEVRFDGSALASGMYVYILRVGNAVATKKLILLH